MLLKLAWRNLWRNARRSVIVLISVIVGLVAIVLYDSLSVGMIQQMLTNQIGSYAAHIQIHKKGFNDNKVIQNYLPAPDSVEALLKNHPQVKAYSKRVITYGIISSAMSSSGVRLVGIEAALERQVTKIDESLTEGRYLSGESHEIVLGRGLAEKLSVGLGDKVVGMASTLQGDIGSDVFRVVGIFETFSSEFDKVVVYIDIGNAREMVGLGENLSEFALLATDLSRVGQLKESLQNRLTAGSPPSREYEVLTYRELLPLLVMQVDVYRESIFIFYGIIAIAMIFGIVNTMLMSVFERIQEFGVLMAVGMKNTRLFFMIMLEALLLGVLGTVIGFVLSYALYWPLSKSGIDLSAFAQGLNAIGSGAVIYPELTLESITSALLVVPLMAVVGAIYPAIKAVRLQPVQAIRHV